MIAVFVLCALSASPEDVRLLIVPMIAGEPRVRPDVAAIVAPIVARFPVLRTIADEELFAAGTEGAVTPECAADATCFARVLERMRADLALVVVINFAIDPPFVATRLFDVRERALIAAVSARDRSFEPLLGSQTRAVLLEAKLEPGARLVVRTDPSGAAIIFDPPLDPREPGIYLARAGRYRLRVALDGFVPQERTIEVREGVSEDLALELAPIRDESWFTSPWFWGVVAGTVVAGTTAAVLIATDTPCLCVGGDDCDC